MVESPDPPPALLGAGAKVFANLAVICQIRDETSASVVADGMADWNCGHEDDVVTGHECAEVIDATIVGPVDGPPRTGQRCAAATTALTSGSLPPASSIYGAVDRTALPKADDHVADSLAAADVEWLKQTGALAQNPPLR